MVGWWVGWVGGMVGWWDGGLDAARASELTFHTTNPPTHHPTIPPSTNPPSPYLVASQMVAPARRTAAIQIHFVDRARCSGSDGISMTAVWMTVGRWLLAWLTSSSAVGAAVGEPAG